MLRGRVGPPPPPVSRKAVFESDRRGALRSAAGTHPSCTPVAVGRGTPARRMRPPRTRTSSRRQNPNQFPPFRSYYDTHLDAPSRRRRHWQVPNCPYLLPLSSINTGGSSSSTRFCQKILSDALAHPFRQSPSSSRFRRPLPLYHPGAEP